MSEELRLFLRTALWAAGAGAAYWIVSAAAAVTIGLGLIFGPWLLLPGLALLAASLIGWITQLDRP